MIDITVRNGFVSVKENGKEVSGLCRVLIDLRVDQVPKIVLVKYDLDLNFASDTDDGVQRVTDVLSTD